MNHSYPTTISEIPNWATAYGVALGNAQQRFVQYVLLSAIAMEPALRAACVFKGGNALDFVLLPNRSTLDSDIVSRALLQKAAARNVPVSRAAFSASGDCRALAP